MANIRVARSRMRAILAGTDFRDERVMQLRDVTPAAVELDPNSIYMARLARCRDLVFSVMENDLSLWRWINWDANGVVRNRALKDLSVSILELGTTFFAQVVPEPEYVVRMLKKLAPKMQFPGSVAANVVDVTGDMLLRQPMQRLTVSFYDFAPSHFDYWWVATHIVREMCYIPRRPAMVQSWLNRRDRDDDVGTDMLTTSLYAKYVHTISKNPEERVRILSKYGLDRTPYIYHLAPLLAEG